MCVGIAFNIREIVMIAGYTIDSSVLLAVGFGIFCGFIAWTIYSQQKRIHELEETNHPIISIGSTIGASTDVREKDSMVDIVVNLAFRNAGNRPAYQISIQTGWAPERHPEMFRPEPAKKFAEPVDPGIEFSISMKISQKFEMQPNGRRGVVSRETLFYCHMKYSDSPENGRWYESERVFKYELGKPLMSMVMEEEKERLMQYVKAAFPTELAN